MTMNFGLCITFLHFEDEGTILQHVGGLTTMGDGDDTGTVAIGNVDEVRVHCPHLFSMQLYMRRASNPNN
jgi:hypothetical protein